MRAVMCSQGDSDGLEKDTYSYLSKLYEPDWKFYVNAHKISVLS